MNPKEMIEAVVGGADPTSVIEALDKPPWFKEVKKALTKHGAKTVKLHKLGNRWSIQWKGDYGPGEEALKSLKWDHKGNKITSSSTTILFQKGNLKAEVYDNPDKGFGILAVTEK